MTTPEAKLSPKLAAELASRQDEARRASPIAPAHLGGKHAKDFSGYEFDEQWQATRIPSGKPKEAGGGQVGQTTNSMSQVEQRIIGWDDEKGEPVHIGTATADQLAQMQIDKTGEGHVVARVDPVRTEEAYAPMMNQQQQQPARTRRQDDSVLAAGPKQPRPAW